MISEGLWVHKSGLYFEGSFHKDRFKKGVFHFTDGDIFEGEWSVRSKKYALLQGTYYYVDGRNVAAKQGENLYIVSRKMNPKQERQYSRKISILEWIVVDSLVCLLYICYRGLATANFRIFGVFGNPKY